MNEQNKTSTKSEIASILEKLGTPEFEKLLDDWVVKKYGTKANGGKVCARCYSAHLPASWRRWFDNKNTSRPWECFICEECYAELYTEETLCV